MLTDTHCHLTLPQFDYDREVVVERAHAAGVDRMVVVGIDADSGEDVLSLVDRYDSMAAAIGLHPHEAGRLDEREKKRLMELARHPRVVAIGETGLDYYRDNSPREAQQTAFRWQIELANQISLPIIVHSRDAHSDTMAILQEYSRSTRLRGVMHCYSGDELMLEQVLNLGMYISLGGPVTYPTARQTTAIARTTPLARLLVETDCPYLPPQPHRGRRNEPSYLGLVVERIAQLRGMDTLEVARVTSANAARLFGLKDEVSVESSLAGVRIE